MSTCRIRRGPGTGASVAAEAASWDPMVDRTAPPRPPLSEATVQAAVTARSAPWRVRVVAETSSTNADVAAAAAAGEPEWLCISTDHQVAGRGRRDRTWTSPRRAGLATSYLVAGRSAQPTWLPLVAGLAVAEATAAASGVDVGLKWPNDVLVEAGPRPGKLGGILVEQLARPPDHFVIGIGLNVTLTEDELPVPTATSLALNGGRTDRDELLAQQAVALGRWVERWRGGDHAAVVAAYRARCATLGRTVVVTTAGGDLRGTATDIGPDGSLIVRRADGSTESVTAGDVVHVR